MKSCLDIEYAGTTLAIEEEGGKAHLGSGRTGSGRGGDAPTPPLGVRTPPGVFQPPPGRRGFASRDAEPPPEGTGTGFPPAALRAAGETDGGWAAVCVWGGGIFTT